MKIHLYNFELYRFKVGAFFWDTVYNHLHVRSRVSGVCE